MMRAKLSVRILIFFVTTSLLIGFGLLWNLEWIPTTHKELKVLFENNEWLKSMVLSEATPSPFLPDVYSQTPKKKLRRCNQCTGGYMKKLEWAQALYSRLRLPWFKYGTDCLAGEEYFKTCSTTCLTLWIQNSTNVNGYEGIGMACADGLIHFSEDIKGVGSRYSNEPIEFHCNRTYINERFGLRITYQFVRADHAEPKILAKMLQESLVLRERSAEASTPTPTPTRTYYVYGILLGIFLIVVVLLFVCPFLCTKGVCLRKFLRSRCRNLFRKKPSGYSYLNQGILNHERSPMIFTDEDDVMLDWRNEGVYFRSNSSYAPLLPPRDLNEHDGLTNFWQVVPSPTMSVPPPPPPRTVAYTGPSRRSSSSIFQDGFDYEPIKNMKLTKLANKTTAELPPSRLNLIPTTPSSSMFESRLSPLTVVENRSETAELMFRI